LDFKLINKIIEMININKSFPNVKAVDNAGIDLYQGEIHSLVGENGAGKTTLMNILYGLYQPDSGKIKIRGKDMESLTPRVAIELGIGMIHQEFMLVRELTVLENIILGFELGKFGRIDFSKTKEKINYYLDNYNLEIPLNKKVRDISVGEAQRVEIIKTLYRSTEILILDEPTAVLTPQETKKLFEILNFLKKDNKSIIFISHKLREVMEISERITIMRNGKHVNTVNKEDVSIKELAKMMVGREVFLNIKREPCKKSKKILSVRDIYVTGEKELSKLKGVSFDVHRGEVVGVAGVDGNGQSELVEALTGLRKIEKGDVTFKGKSIKNLSPIEIRKAGISHIPEDRNLRGLNRSFTLYENLIANHFNKKPYSRLIQLNKKKITKYGNRLIKEFDIRPAIGNTVAVNLSGGNAQKTVVAREVDMNADLLIASQPTRGVDVGSTEAIRNTINYIKKKGVAVLLVSADLEEILSLSDVILVMYEGKISGIIPAEKAREDNIGILMTGGKVK